MRHGARTPEELEALFEDAFVLRDAGALASLFEPRALLVAGGVMGEVRGSEEIALSAPALWSREFTYLADPQHVIQARDLALVLATQGTSVVRRGTDGAWRYAISLLTIDDQGGTMTEQSTQPLEHVIVHQDEGEAWWWFEALAVIRATAADTGGQMTIVEVTEPPGHEAPLHVHHREDEAFFILDGSATIHVGDESFKVGPGDYAFGPRDIPHRYSIGPDGCRMLFICTPAGFENLVKEMSVPAERRTLPPPSNDVPDWEHVAAIAEANGCELLA